MGPDALWLRDWQWEDWAAKPVGGSPKCEDGKHKHKGAKVESEKTKGRRHSNWARLELNQMGVGPRLAVGGVGGKASLGIPKFKDSKHERQRKHKGETDQRKQSPDQA
jgi:hypothetical protein